MNNSLISMESARTSILDRLSARSSRSCVAGPQVLMLRGRAAIAAKVPMLQELCERTGQAGAMRWLEYRMAKPTEAKKIPTLVLVGLNAGVTPEAATADDVLGAVMLYEYKFAGMGLKLFATGDMTGLVTVIAPAEIRIQVAEAATAELMERGALATLISVAPDMKDTQPERVRDTPAKGFEMAQAVRSVPLGLPLGKTFQETLAGLGKHTRRNLRYYRRRLESEMGSEFVPQVEMGREEFLEFNRTSMNPAPEEWTEWRYDSSQNEPGMMFAGMRAQDGRWLSLIGGRRNGEEIEIDWQMNRGGMTDYSLSTVMRSYVLEHETALGTKDMVFTGGTPHSMRHSFACVEATDVVAMKRSPLGAGLRRLAGRIAPRNFLAQTLRDEKLRWE